MSVWVSGCDVVPPEPAHRGADLLRHAEAGLLHELTEADQVVPPRALAEAVQESFDRELRCLLR